MNNHYKVMRVSGKSDPAKVAGALASFVKDVSKNNHDVKTFCELNCIGASSVNQGVKAVAIANGMLAPLGIQIVIKPAFSDIHLHDEDRTAIRQIIQREMM